MGFCLWGLLVSNRYRLWFALFVGGRASRLSGVASGGVYWCVEKVKETREVKGVV